MFVKSVVLIYLTLCKSEAAMASSLFHRFHARFARGAQGLLLASCVVALAGCMSVSTQKIGMVPVAAADPVYTFNCRIRSLRRCQTKAA